MGRAIIEGIDQQVGVGYDHYPALHSEVLDLQFIVELVESQRIDAWDKSAPVGNDLIRLRFRPL